MILGVNAYYHNAGVGAYEDGRVSAAVEEERFDRVKKSSAFPRLSLAYLGELGLAASGIERVAFPWVPRHFIGTYANVVRDNFPRSLQLLHPAASSESNASMPLKAAFQLGRDLRKELGGSPSVRYVGHHWAHAALAFFGSPFDESLVLVSDGVGDACTTSAYIGSGNSLRQVYRNDFMDSLGVLYSCVTKHLGYRTIHDEGKIMALASYGSDRYLDEFSRIFEFRDDGTYTFDRSYLNFQNAGEWKPFSKKFEERFGRARHADEPVEQHHMDLAAALQGSLERCLCTLVSGLARKHGQDRLAFAGGVAMNCVTNGLLARDLGLQEVYVPPNPDDGGVSLGAAMYVHHCDLDRPRGEPVTSASHGPGFTEAEVEAALRGRPYRRVEDPAETAAALLAEGLTVGWFRGRLEMGPRALGNRSLLADPRREDIREHLNSSVKHREWFRPYAPSVLEEGVDEYFVRCPASPFMSFASEVREEHRASVPGIVHVDGTARLQTVSGDVVPDYHRLISAFQRRTGIPMVLNTSLNDQEPICCTPADAASCFDRAGFDALVVEDFALARADCPEAQGVIDSGAPEPDAAES